MRVIVVGGERLVYFLSRTFVSRGYHVTIINRDRDECKRLARILKVTVVFGDGSDIRILEEAGARTADSLLAVTPNDQDNLITCQLAENHFRIPRTLALANDPDNEEIFLKLGISGVFSTTRILASLLEEKAGYESILNLIPVGEGKINVTEIVLEDDSPVIEKTLSEIKVPENSLIASIIRDNKPIVPRGQTALKAKDRLIVVSLPENLGEVLKILVGNREH